MVTRSMAATSKPSASILKSLDSKNPGFDPKNSETTLDFLLSVYVSIQQNMNVVEGDDSTSIYNMPDAQKDLVAKNKEKDLIIKKRIQEIIISGLSSANKEGAFLPSYTFIKSLLGAFSEFIRGGEGSIPEKQVEGILDYLISLLDQQVDLLESLNEESKETPQKESDSKAKKDKKSVKPPSAAKERPSSKTPTKSEKDSKQSEDTESHIDDNNSDNLDLVIPSILNFINSYFLSKTPQDINLSEYRKKRIEQRKKLEESKQPKKSALTKDDDAKDELAVDTNNATVDGLNEEIFEKPDKITDENGKPCLCTFSKTRRNYSNQHWYMCFTCGLNTNEGVCWVCAKTCHKDHEIVYCKTSSFFCDCQFKFNCISLPDEYKESSGYQPKNELDFGGFSYDRQDYRSPFSSNAPWGGSSGRGRGGYGQSDYSRGGLFGDSYRGGRGGRGRGGRGRPMKKSMPENEFMDSYKKLKKNKQFAVKRSDGKKSAWKPMKRTGMEDSIDKFMDIDQPEEDELLEDRYDSSSGSEDIKSSESIGEGDEGEESEDIDEIPKQVKAPKKKDYEGGLFEEDMINEDELMLYDDFIEEKDDLQVKPVSYLSKYDDFQQVNKSKLWKSHNKELKPKPKSKAVNKLPSDPDDDDGGEGEHDSEGEGEGEEDKKMEEHEEDYKSMSSSDAKMDKDSSYPAKSGDGKELEIIDETPEEIIGQPDVDMDTNSEDFLDKFDKRLYKIFSESPQKDTFPKSLLDKFHKLIKHIKKRSSKLTEKPNPSASSRDKILEGLIYKDKKLIFSNSGTITKRTFNAGSLNMTSKISDDSYNNLTIGIPGQINFLIPKNIFACNSVGLLAFAEGDVVSLATTENI